MKRLSQASDEQISWIVEANVLVSLLIGGVLIVGLMSELRNRFCSTSWAFFRRRRRTAPEPETPGTPETHTCRLGHAFNSSRQMPDRLHLQLR